MCPAPTIASRPVAEIVLVMDSDTDTDEVQTGTGTYIDSGFVVVTFAIVVILESKIPKAGFQDGCQYLAQVYNVTPLVL